MSSLNNGYLQHNGVDSGQFTNGWALLEQPRGRVVVVLGAQWGDEGKGKLVDLLAPKMDVVTRCQGGNNAGHTVVVGSRIYDFHLLPSGIIHPNCVAVVGNGVVVHLPGLFAEIEKNGVVGWENRLILSNRAQIVFDFLQLVDGLQETERAEKKLGTTKKGIGPTYSSKYWRSGIRLCELVGDFSLFEKRYRSLLSYYQKLFPSLIWDPEQELTKLKEYSERLRELGIVRDTVEFFDEVLTSEQPKNIMVEGANGALLDIDFGTYPYVTSSNCTVGGVFTGLGIPASVVSEVVGIVKAYQTRVGDGPFPSELCNETGERLREIGGEYGVTTGRPRRCGWLDLFLLRYSKKINGYTGFALTKLDVLDSFAQISVVVGYRLDGQLINSVPATVQELERVVPEYRVFPGWKSETKAARRFSDLPDEARSYISFIENFVKVPVMWIGVGKDREAMIDRRTRL